MVEHHALSNETFERQFENCQMNPDLFTHEAHLRLAWIHLNKYDLKTATDNVCRQILKFDIVHGKGEKFNKTVTVASVKVMNHFMQKSKSSNFFNLIQAHPRLKLNFKDLLDFHYGFDIFNCEKAKIHFLEPDLEAFE